jgi:hypothetical protein
MRKSLRYTEKQMCGKNNCGRATKKQESKEDGESRRCFLSCVHFTIMFYFVSESHTVDSMFCDR